ncbi:coiled-coil domain-containing protein 6 [Tritrichomonas foetus]|uniref:Coiled-coil domain-containing protein 6 n=1 Tax=Tritrichomonas foetus TaxID=1144522 RepID=A0A1J4KEN2_9EUKA|nr:coiled-coil domain-containing protein 6 [Tritrichomonas foetus]|eukprot:OHT09659.1 coiled-coil domain-containing protein 6 [Tritrichomonas foetus]
MTDEKAALIEQIKKTRAENESLRSQVSTLEDRKKQLQDLSQVLQAVIADKAAREIESINNERVYISQKSVEEEEILKAAFEKRLSEVIREKVELERRLEAESEFVSRNLRQRLTAIHAKTHQLRAELHKKSKEVTESLLHMSPDEALKTMIQTNQDACLEISSKIAESHREIEGMQAKAERLKTILEHLQAKVQEKPKDHILIKKPSFEEPRRKSYTNTLKTKNLQ